MLQVFGFQDKIARVCLIHMAGIYGSKYEGRSLGGGGGQGVRPAAPPPPQFLPPPRS